MPSIFSRILNGEIPSYKIAETEDYYAFLDAFPVKEGHTLVIPKKEIDYIFDLEDDQLAGLMVFSKKIAAAIKKAIPCNRVGVTVIGLEVPHAHVHLIPIDNLNDMSFEKPKLKISAEKMTAIAASIRACLDA